MEFDVLIIGSGIAGLCAAMKLSSDPSVRVGVVTREPNVDETNTFYAQGGIIYSQTKEDQDALVSDIEKAGAFTGHPEMAKILAYRSKKVMDEILLQKAQAPFERDENGKLKVTKEAAHSSARILYKGDYTGRAIQESLSNYLNNKELCPNVTFLRSYTAVDLITPKHHGNKIQQRYEETKVLGAYLLDQNKNEVVTVISRVTILATGGIGSLYLHHSNSEGARGDGHAMAARAGAELVNMEFIQFHPTTFYDRSSHRRFLVSEAMRGEGGVLLNANGERFMGRYHPDKELAPRDVVARAILEEMVLHRDDCVYLDITHKDAQWIKNRFPTIYSHCLEKGVDITIDPIPVVPAAHYTCGGVKTDDCGHTTLKHLYAVGEVACTGLHGANRLASTSLLEGLVWGYFAAEDILKQWKTIPLYDRTRIREWHLADGECDLTLISQDWLTVKQSMWNYVGVVRSSNRLNRAKVMFLELREEVERFYKNVRLHDQLIGLRNAIEVARIVVDASTRNKKSAGCFYRVN